MTSNFIRTCMLQIWRTNFEIENQCIGVCAVKVLCMASTGLEADCCFVEGCQPAENM